MVNKMQMTHITITVRSIIRNHKIHTHLNTRSEGNMNIRKIKAAALGILMLCLSALSVHAENTAEDVCPVTNTPRPEIALFASEDISEEAVEKSTELYNNFLSVDPEMFLLTDEGIGYLSWWGMPTDNELAYLENMAAEITKDCTNEFEKISAVTEYVAKNVCYDHDFYTHDSKDWTEVNLDPYDVLVNGSTICEGYARTTATLLQMVDVACIYVDSPNHKWNMAYDGERWIMFDTTWISGGRLEYGVLNKSDELWLDWFDFTLEKANSDESHLIEEVALSISDGSLTSFPRYTSLGDIELPSSVKTIAEKVYFPENIDTLRIPESVVSIGGYCFRSSNIGTIYYEGSRAEYKNITIGTYNSGITNCRNIIYADNAAKPYILKQPTATIGAVGIPISVSIEAACATSNITYRWYKNDTSSSVGGTLISGETSNICTFTPDSEGKIYLYAEVVSRDDSVSGEREAVTKSIPVSVEVFKELPSEIKQIGTSVRYIKFAETKEAYIVGNGEIPKGTYIYDETGDISVLHISSGITAIEGELNLYGLQTITVDEGNETFYIDEYGALIDNVQKKLVKLPSLSTVEKYIMPDDIVEVAPYAFRFCDMSEVVMSSKLKTIGKGAFYNCNNIWRYFIPETVETIDSKAFQYNQNLTCIFFFGNVPSFGTEVFVNFDSSSELTICYIEGTDWTSPTWQDKSGNTYNTVCFDPELINSPNCCGPSAVWELRDGVLTISGNGIMWGYSSAGDAPWASERASITSIVVGEGITNIGDKCFMYAQFSSLTLPSTLKSIGKYVFFNCLRVTSLTLPDGLTSIGEMAFAYNYNLSEPIVIPTSVTTLGANAFRDCTDIHNAYFRGNVPTTWGNTALPSSVTIYYPSGNTSGWTTPTWTAADGTTYNTVAHVYETEEDENTLTLTGKVTSYNPRIATTVQLMQGSEIKYTTTLEPTSATGQVTETFTISDIASGTYDLVVSKAGHLTYTVTGVTVSSADIDLTESEREYGNITLIAGDVNGDGSVTESDVAVMRYSTNVNKFTSEAADPDADLNGDGSITEGDVLIARYAAHMNKGTENCTFEY